MTDNFVVLQDRSESNMIFVHSRIDDMGLSQSVFRVYCHLARRAGTGEAYPGIDSISKICVMAKNTTIEAIRILENLKMIVAKRTPGATTRYYLTKPSCWKALPEMNQFKLDTGSNEVTDRRNSGNATVAIQVTKGNPTKVIQKGNPSGINKFQKPTLQEVKDYFKRKNLPETEAEKFCYYHESKGWVVGKLSMRNWHAAVGTWAMNLAERQQPQTAPVNRNGCHSLLNG